MRICFIGDSFVNGTGDPEHLGWTGRVAAAAHAGGLDLTAYNLGVRRETSLEIASRWRAESEPRLPESEDGRLVFSFGVNDCAEEEGGRRVSQEATVEAAAPLLAQARDWKPTLMVGPPPIGDGVVNDRVRILCRDFEALCRALGIPYLDVFENLAASETWMAEVEANDGAHPGAAGYTVLADLVQDWDAWQTWMSQP